MTCHEPHPGAEPAQRMLLPDWLARRADVAPDGPALIAGRVGWTFRQLDRRATATARQLAALGVGADDRVALLMRNGPQFVTLVHALARLGAVLVPLNTRLTAPELIWQLTDAGVRLLVHDGHHPSLVTAIRGMLPDLPTVAADRAGPGGTVGREPGPVASILEDQPAEIPAPAPADTVALTDIIQADVPLRQWIDLSTVHSIIYTSGTTGRPKGAVLTYGNHWWSAVGSALNLGNHHDDRWLAVLPLFHVGGLAILLRSVIYGVPAVVHESFDPVAVNRSIDEDGVTIVSVVSTMLQRMLRERGDRPYPKTLRCVLLGGGPAPQVLLEDCARRGVPVVQTYGLTETASQVATLAPIDALRKLGSAGKPLLPTELRIDQDGVPAAPGKAGEIVVRGPTVTIGYLNRPGETARTIQNGWLHTGDLGYLDGEGYLYVLDRRQDLIVSGGENIYPAEVEATLLTHPAIEEAGVVGIPDAHWGQVPVAAIKARQGIPLSEADIIAFCGEQLARYKIPKRVRFLDSLPRNAAGKLLRSTLRVAFTGEDEPDTAVGKGRP